MDSKSEGGESLSWQAPEYVEHHHSTGWFMLLALGTAATAGLVYLLLKDIFGVVIIGLLGFIVAVAASRQPRLMTYQLTASSLKIGDKDYPLRLFKSFTTASEGELESATLLPLKRFMPPIAIYIKLDEAEPILDRLAEVLPHDERAPDAVDRLARRLRF